MRDITRHHLLQFNFNFKSAKLPNLYCVHECLPHRACNLPIGPSLHQVVLLRGIGEKVEEPLTARLLRISLLQQELLLAPDQLVLPTSEHSRPSSFFVVLHKSFVVCFVKTRCWPGPNWGWFLFLETFLLCSAEATSFHCPDLQGPWYLPPREWSPSSPWCRRAPPQPLPSCHWVDCAQTQPPSHLPRTPPPLLLSEASLKDQTCAN